MTHNGERYNVRMLKAFRTTYDRWGSSCTRGNVLILDKKTGKMYQRVGVGKDLGNFHPVWVRTRRQPDGSCSMQVEALLRETRDCFGSRPTRFFRPDHVRAMLTEGEKN